MTKALNTSSQTTLSAEEGTLDASLSRVFKLDNASALTRSEQLPVENEKQSTVTMKEVEVVKEKPKPAPKPKNKVSKSILWSLWFNMYRYGFFP